jgi:hypothetical protein
VQAALGAPPPDPPALALLVHGVHVPLVYHLHPPLVRLDHFDLFLHPVTCEKRQFYFSPSGAPVSVVRSDATLPPFGNRSSTGDLNIEHVRRSIKLPFSLNLIFNVFTSMMRAKLADNVVSVERAPYLNQGSDFGCFSAEIFWKFPKNTQAKWNYRLYVGPQNVLRYI